jgi:Ca2+-binding EF-hand superfamily protein
MTRHKRTILYLAAAAAVTVPAAAQIEGLDADGDGKITRREYIDARSARFTQLDKDRDGRLTAEDFPRASQSQSLTALAGRLVAHADLNQDGAVSQDELGLAGTPLFDRADSNGDGFVDREEVARLRTMLTRRR